MIFKIEITAKIKYCYRKPKDKIGKQKPQRLFNLNDILEYKNSNVRL